MNLLLVNYEFPPLGGGAGNATENIAHSFVLSGENVLVIGCGDVGSEVALDLLLKNKRVTVIDIISEEAMFAEEVTFYRKGIYTKIKNLDARFINKVRIIKIEKNKVTMLDSNNKQEEIHIDNIIISSGFKCKSREVERLIESFNGKVKEIFSIGDCMSIGRLFEAIHAGAETAWQI